MGYKVKTDSWGYSKVSSNETLSDNEVYLELLPELPTSNQYFYCYSEEDEAFVLNETLLDEAKIKILKKIKDALEALVASAKAEYCETEMLTWEVQYAEAVAYTADNTADTTLLALIADARGSDVDTLAASIISNYTSWLETVGPLIGKRLAMADTVNTCETVAEVLAVEISFS